MRDQELQPVFKGRISEFGEEKDEFGAPTHARVLPIMTPDSPTPLYKIAYFCRKPRFELEIDTLVVCARFEDGTGMILIPFEDEFTGHVPGDIHIDKGELPNADVHVEESVEVGKDVTVKGTVTADVDVVGADVSLSSHTHAGSAPPDR